MEAVVIQKAQRGRNRQSCNLPKHRKGDCSCSHPLHPGILCILMAFFFFSGLGFFLPDALRILGHALPEDTGWWAEESSIGAQGNFNLSCKGEGGGSEEQQSMPTDQLLSRLEWVR